MNTELTPIEIDVLANLFTHLKLPAEQFAKLTNEQKFSAARVIHRQGYGVKHSYLDTVLCITFRHIFIGIEPDGYAHS